MDEEEVDEEEEEEALVPVSRSSQALERATARGDGDALPPAIDELQNVLEVWQAQIDDGAPFHARPTLLRAAELIEDEASKYLQCDPDPFDDRHPCRTVPNSTFGPLLKVVFRSENFVTKLVSSYLLARDNLALNETAARLLLDVVPGLDASEVFRDWENIVPQLFRWAMADDTAEPLRSYAVGLIAVSMEVSDISAEYRAQNALLVPVMLARLRALRDAHFNTAASASDSAQVASSSEASTSPDAAILSPTVGPFANLKPESYPDDAERPSLHEVLLERVQNGQEDSPASSSDRAEGVPSIRVRRRRAPSPPAAAAAAAEERSPARKRARLMDAAADLASTAAVASVWANRGSQSAWAEVEPLLIGHHCIHPLSSSMQQRLILHYLIPTAESVDLLSYALDSDSLELVFSYIDVARSRDVRLAFDALRYLASLLVHRRLALAFVAREGVTKLLGIPRASMASAGVSLCIYYLAYCEEVMERLCLLPHPLLVDLVSYALWLLEHSYESGRCHAAMFFSHAFAFRTVLELFDQQDGLRKLYNYVSTLTILQTDDQSDDLNDDQVYQSRNAVRDVCITLRNYFMAHINIKVDSMRRFSRQNFPNAAGLNLPASVAPNKGMHLDSDGLRDCIWLLLHALPINAIWRPVEAFRKLGIVRMLLLVLSEAVDWPNRAEVMRTALEILWITTANARVQMDLCETFKLRDDEPRDGFGVLIKLCESAAAVSEAGGARDPDVKKAALNVLINCVCAPTARAGAPTVQSLPSPHPTARNTLPLYPAEQAQPMLQQMTDEVAGKRRARPLDEAGLLERVWAAVRKNDGILVLQTLIQCDGSLSDADSLRTLACHALEGLSRSDVVRQILGKMPLISANKLHFLMKQPVLKERRHVHSKFCEYARSLIERVTGRPASEFPKDLTQEKIWRAYIVSQTKIVYNEKELLQLIYQHLRKNGLSRTAALLLREAELPNVPASLATAPARPLKPLPCRVTAAFEQLRPKLPALTGATGGISGTLAAAAEHWRAPPPPPPPPLTSTPLPKQRAAPPTPAGASAPARKTLTPRTPGCRQKLAVAAFAAAATAGATASSSSLRKMKPIFGLSDMVHDYFRKQHATCDNPAAVCPPFSVFYPHRCPDPKFNRLAPYNLAARLQRRPIYPVAGGADGVRADLRFVYGRVKAVRTLRDADADETFTCCTFSADNEHVLLGTFTGDLKWYSVSSGEEESTQTCHASALSSVEQTRDGSYLLTSSLFVKPYSSLWKVGETLESKLNLDLDNYVEFSKNPQDRLVGTQAERAVVYDLMTGRPVVRLYDEAKANHYARNRATFHPRDDLVLSDGVLWDVRSASVVHKFDKLNPHISGVFHPRGLEVIINTEVWDVRTYRLLHVVPELNQCKVVFSESGDTMFGVVCAADMDDFEDSEPTRPPETNFRAFDATDYTLIATHDVRHKLVDLTADANDVFVATIERSALEDADEKNVCRLYELGKHRDVEDANEEEEEVDVDGGGGGGGGSGDVDYDTDETDEDDEDDTRAIFAEDDDDDEEDEEEEEEDDDEVLAEDGDEAAAADGDDDEDDEDEQSPAQDSHSSVSSSSADDSDQSDGSEDLVEEAAGDGDGDAGSDSSSSRAEAPRLVLNPTLRRQQRRHPPQPQ